MAPKTYDYDIIGLQNVLENLNNKISEIEDKSEQGVYQAALIVERESKQRTPVDTGAYAESFSVLPAASGGGRRESSDGRPKRQSLRLYRGIAESNMNSDIDKLEPLDGKSVAFRNRAPHASKVETKREVFGAVKDIWR